MKFTYDHDLHIHSVLSDCSRDSEQNPERILIYAKENNLKTICLTDHFWDSAVPGASQWYSFQNYEHISKSLPLPQDKNVKFLFGCETEFDKHMTIGICAERFASFDFVIIPTTHFHMTDFTISAKDSATPEGIAGMWVKKLNTLLEMDLPFKKIGIAHLTCGLIARPREKYIKTMETISDKNMEDIFKQAACLGVGIELNYDDMTFSENEAQTILRPYQIAKECGCKFYCGSDAHHPNVFANTKNIFEKTIDILNLKESDKFLI